MAWGTKGGDAPQRSAGGSLSFIGSEVTITGNVNATGDMHIDGTVEGDVECGQLVLGPTGNVKGHIVAQRATVAGSVNGTVNAVELVVERSARLTGDLNYDNISIENGAKVDGRLTQKGSGSADLKLVSAVNE